MDEILKKLIDISDEPYAWLENWKKTNQKKVVGCFPMYFPEELVHAAGLMPFMVQRTTDRITLAPALTPSFVCDFSRSVLDLIMGSRLDFADGLIFQNTCYIIEGLVQIVQKIRPHLYLDFLFQPKLLEYAASRGYYLEQLQKLKGSLEKTSGQKITEDRLRESIHVYNQNRSLLRRLYDFRRQNPGAIRSREVMAIVHSGMLMPKEAHNRILTELLPKIDARKSTRSGVRVILTGTMCESSSVDVLDFLDDHGLLVADDDIYVGSRYFPLDCQEKGDPFNAIVDRHLNMIPDPTLHNLHKEYGDFLKDRYTKAHAQAIIVLQVLHCEPAWYEYARWKEKLQPDGIPHFYVETEQESLSMGRIRTRVEAFVEMCNQGTGKDKIAPGR